MASEEPAFSPLVLLVRRWKVVAIGTALGTALAVAYALLAPKWYVSTLSVMPTPSSPSDASALMSMTKDLPETLGIAAGVSSDSERIASVLSSNSVQDAVIKKFDLIKRYGEDDLESTRETLRKHLLVTVDRKSDLVTLACEDTDPATAKAMADYFGELGAQNLRRISASSAQDERRFLEARVTEARAAVDEASRKLRVFRENNKIIDLEQQAKAVVSAMGTLEGDLLSKQLQLSYLDDFSSSKEASVVQLQSQINALQAEMKKLQEGRSAEKPDAPPPGGFFPPTATVPKLAFEYAQLYREEQIQERVFFLLTMQHELAKVKEARDTATFQILDAPTLPTEKARPKRRIVVIVGIMIGAAAGALWVLVLGWWRSATARLPEATDA